MMQKPSPWMWRGLHLLLALALPIALALLAGCKRASEKHADLGPEVDANVIETKLWAIENQVNLDNLHVGQYVNTVVLRRIENSDDVNVLAGVTVGVIDAQDSDDHQSTKYTLQINKSYLNDKSGFDTISSEDNLHLRKPSSAVPLSLLANAEPHLKSLKEISQEAVHAYATGDAQPTKITYHKFSEGDENFEVPAKLKMKADCGGLSPCQIPIHYLQFDMVLWYSDQDYQKITFDFGFSTSTPWLPFGTGFDILNGVLVEDCRATFIDVGDQNVYVRDCQQLDDLQK
jgi:hypothetical protein